MVATDAYIYIYKYILRFVWVSDSNEWYYKSHTVTQTLSCNYSKNILDVLCFIFSSSFITPYWMHFESIAMVENYGSTDKRVVSIELLAGWLAHKYKKSGLYVWIFLGWWFWLLNTKQFGLTSWRGDRVTVWLSPFCGKRFIYQSISWMLYHQLILFLVNWMNYIFRNTSRKTIPHPAVSQHSELFVRMSVFVNFVYRSESLFGCNYFSRTGFHCMFASQPHNEFAVFGTSFSLL